MSLENGNPIAIVRDKAQSAALWHGVRLEHVTRKFRCGFPLSEVGMLQSWNVDKALVFSNKLELSIRLSSTDEKIDDVIDGRKFRMRTPNVVVKIPGIEHRLSFNSPRDTFFFAYSPSLKDKLEGAGLLEPPWGWEFQLTPELLTLLRQVKESMNHLMEYGTAERLDLLALQVWQLLLQERQHQAFPDDVEVKLRRITTYLQLHFCEQIDFDELAAENGLSRSSFFRYWRSRFQVTPARYVQDLKMAEACRLLQDSHHKVWRIAQMLNFKHTRYFCSVFRNKFNMTPQQFRNQSGKS